MRLSEFLFLSFASFLSLRSDRRLAKYGRMTGRARKLTLVSDAANGVSGASRHGRAVGTSLFEAVFKSSPCRGIQQSHWCAAFESSRF